MKTEVKTMDMLTYIADEWKVAHHWMEKMGRGDERVDMRTSWCIGMKEMTEALIGVPVNLKMDGQVTIGLDEEFVIPPSDNPLCM